MMRWSLRNPADARLLGVLGFVVMFAAVSSFIGWQSANHLMKQVVESERTVAGFVSEQRKVQSKLENRSIELQQQTDRATQARTRSDVEISRMAEETEQLNVTLKEIALTTDEIKSINLQLASKKAELSNIDREISSTESKVSQSKRALGEMLVVDDVEREAYLKQRINLAVGAMERNDFVTAANELAEIPNVLRCWPTDALQSLVNERRNTFPVRSIDLSKLSADFSTWNGKLFATISPYNGSDPYRIFIKHVVLAGQRQLRAYCS